MSDNNAFMCGFISGVITMALVLTFIVDLDKGWHDEAIDRGYAEHDNITGEWQWKAK